MNASVALKSYAKVGIESGVHSADPHKLVSMLFQGAILAVANGKNGILRNDLAAKGKGISHAIAIIGEGLHASLDKKVGGELAQNLSGLYEYMVAQLVQANLNNDIEKLDEVSRLLADLKGAWESIRTVVASQPAANSENILATQPPPNAASGQAQRLYGRA